MDIKKRARIALGNKIAGNRLWMQRKRYIEVEIMCGISGFIDLPTPNNHEITTI